MSPNKRVRGCSRECGEQQRHVHLNEPVDRNSRLSPLPKNKNTRCGARSARTSRCREDPVAQSPRNRSARCASSHLLWQSPPRPLQNCSQSAGSTPYQEVNGNRISLFCNRHWALSMVIHGLRPVASIKDPLLKNILFAAACSQYACKRSSSCSVTTPKASAFRSSSSGSATWRARA